MQCVGRPPIHRVCCVLVLLATAVGCGGGASKTAESDDTESSATRAVNPVSDSSATRQDPGAAQGSGKREVVAAVTADRVPSSANPEHFVGLNPSEDGWNTEELHQATNVQLNRLAKWLSTATGPLTELSPITTEEFQCGELRPLKLVDVVEGDAFTVRRPPGPPTAVDTASYSEISGLTAAGRRLMEPLAGATDLRVHFKQYRIRAEGDTLESTVLFRAVGRLAGGSLQLNSVWECTWKRDGQESAPLLTSLNIHGYEEVQVHTDRGTLFSDLTAAVAGGVDSYRQQLAWGANYWKERLIRLDLNLYQGLALGDVNGDGLDDLYICQTWELPNRLLIQNPDGTVADRSAEAGVDFLDATRSALIVDLDNDGDQDLLVGAVGALLLMENDGSGQFKVREALPGGRDAFSLAVADYDHDGLLDIYVCRYYPEDTKRGLIAFPIPYQNANNGEPNRLFRNRGNWKFADVTEEVGLDANNTRFSLAACWEDYDNDGDLDLYVANDFGRNNLYRHDGDRFEDVAATTGAQDTAFGMSVAWGDYDRNGWMDLYVSNMFSAAGNRITYQQQFLSDEGEELRELTQYMVRGNSLFSNSGQGTFNDVSLSTGVTMGRWAWSSAFADIDNDGWEDLLVTNGYVTGPDLDDL